MKIATITKPAANQVAPLRILLGRQHS